MSFDWILILLAIVVVQIVGVLFMMRTIRAERNRSEAESGELRGLMEALHSDVERQKAQLHDLEAAQSQVSMAQNAPFYHRSDPSATLSVDKRAEALEMMRLGADSETVCARLQLSSADAELLEKVQKMLGRPTGR